MLIHVPAALERLPELARNLWWSWNPEARALFEVLAGSVPEPPHHNPVRLLQGLPPEELEARAKEPEFVGRYRAVLNAFEADLAGRTSWFASRSPHLTGAPIAYFSAEFGVHSALPVYAGGLGILAGDIAKEASDLGVPLVGVGFMYPQGYFHQHVSADGRQEEISERLDRALAPTEPACTEPGRPCVVPLQLPDRLLHDHANEAGRSPGWLSIPLVLTSHTWENAKNERSHQDPSLAEALLGEPADVSRVLFPADYNTAAALMRAVYQTRGQMWALVVPKVEASPDLFAPAEAEQLLQDGALGLDWAGHQADRPRAVLAAVGAYQLGQVLRASRRLAERAVAHSVVYLLEPGRFRAPRNPREAAHMAPAEVRQRLFPDGVAARVFLTHTRPETLLGILQPLHTGRGTVALGYTNHGGTLNTPGLLFVNRSTWGHCVERVARLLGMSRDALLGSEELAALDHRAEPEGRII